MRPLIDIECEQASAANGEPTAPPAVTPSPGYIGEVLDQLQHLHDRPGTY